MLTPDSAESLILNKFAVVIITGGSSGIGNEFLKAIINVNTHAVICNLSRSKPENFPIKTGHHHFTCDFSNTSVIDSVVGNVITAILTAPEGPVLLINNSGFGAYGVFPDPALARYEEMISVNVMAPVKLTGLLWPILQKRTGWIINVASIGAFQPTPFMGVYGATKAFVLHWSLALNLEGKSQNIRALALCPGVTVSRFFSNAGFSSDRVPGVRQTPERVVYEAIRALHKGKSQVVTGWLNKLSIFFSMRLPKPWSAFFAYLSIKKMRMGELDK
ncbi:MAG: SDR family NAD(P)-dependent oxidoreductase [Puniceicoccales bacterium]|jgi:short-subunit dehydrogenase|nr:SDR family NAD(P)-dependent oxidoreductase [Puniceicoccales bacterium]